jgi:hypothetical protein
LDVKRDALAAKKSRLLTPSAGNACATGVLWRILFLCDLFLFGARDVRTTIFDQVATGQ